MANKKIAVISNDSYKGVHQVTYENYFTKQGVEAFERGLDDLRKKSLEIEANNKKNDHINLKIDGCLTLKINLKN